ncbi:MAG: Oligopeptide transport system permease protein OppC [Chlamydiia bacterium]|nr:Oligopeptide transport system permease protein OppC [Chlamydiia bacterium]
MLESRDLFAPIEPIRHESVRPVQSQSYIKDSFLRLCKNRMAMGAVGVLALLIFLSIVVPPFSTAKYYETHLSMKNSPPSFQYWFGTDELGRSILSRIWIGARISLFVGISAALIDSIFGVLYGAVSGFIGGRVDEILMRITDIFHSIPNLLITIMLMVVLDQGVFTIILALALTGWVNMARIIRAQILTLKEQDFITAAHLIGSSKWRIILRHLIPNTFGTVITTLTFSIPTAIFTEGFLSFLGLGVQAPVASWGTMASDGLSALSFYPWRIFFPAAFICITMVSFNILGDGLRDAFDPRIN